MCAVFPMSPVTDLNSTRDKPWSQVPRRIVLYLGSTFSMTTASFAASSTAAPSASFIHGTRCRTMPANSRTFGRASELRVRPVIVIFSPEKLSVIPLYRQIGHPNPTSLRRASRTSAGGVLSRDMFRSTNILGLPRLYPVRITVPASGDNRAWHPGNHGANSARKKTAEFGAGRLNDPMGSISLTLSEK